MADLGSDVVKVEPPGGDPGRRVPPFADDRPELERSLAWLAANVNKRGITCNLEVESGRALFRRLAARADIVVETFPPGTLERLGLGYDELAKSNHGLILTSITPFGTQGPRATWPASDLEVTASSGSLWLAGDPQRPPIRGTLPQSPCWAGMYGAMSTLLAVLARDVSGWGQHADVSAQESMITAIAHAPVFWDLLRENPARLGPSLSGRSVTGAAFRNVWPCRDGYITFSLYGGAAGRRAARALVAWMDEQGGAPEALNRMDWEQFDVATATPETVGELEAAIAPFLLSLTRAEFFKSVMERNILGYPVATVEDIAHDEQLLAREFWTQVPTPWDSDRSLPFPGSFALFDGTRPPIRRAAPRLGEHNVEVYDDLGLRADELTALRGAGVL